MSDLDNRILAAWDGDTPPPARDGLFRVEVLARVERRAYRTNLISVVVLGLAASILVWLAAPRLAEGIAALSIPASALVGVILALGLAPAAWGLNRVYRFI